MTLHGDQLAGFKNSDEWYTPTGDQLKRQESVLFDDQPGIEEKDE